MTTYGVDYPWQHPAPAALAAAGKTFAARYLSHDPSKDVTRAEAAALAEAGIWCVVVWETTAGRALAGRAGGIADAKEAAALAEACGMPGSRPIYFAVDFEPASTQMPSVLAYLDGAASVLGAARTGVYGGYATVHAALDGGHAHWAWQTTAWSAGRWDPRAVIRQAAEQVHIGGAEVDLDTAYAADFGQWKPGITPQEDDMTPDQEAKLDRLLAIAEGPGILAYRNAAADAASVKASGQHIPDVYGYITGTNYLLHRLVAMVGAQAATIATLAKNPAATLDQIEQAGYAGASKALAEGVVPVAVDVNDHTATATGA